MLSLSVYMKAGKKERISVPVHGNKDLKLGLLKAVMKIAEIEEIVYREDKTDEWKNKQENNPNADQIIHSSRAWYATPRQKVEGDIIRRLKAYKNDDKNE